MQLAGPCAGSRAAAGHLPASLFTGSKPPTRVPNQSAALGRSSTPHKSQSRHSLSSIQARRRSEAIAAAGVRSGIISWAGRCRRGHGGISGTPEHAMARARLTINAALSPQEAAGQPGARTEATRALRLACAGLWTPRARCWSPARNMGVAANGSCGDLGGAPPRKVTPLYPILHPATCSWARAQHVHRGSSHAGSLCCEAGRLLQEAARCGPVSARSGAAMQLAGPCAGSRAAAGHLPASLFTESKPPTRVPNQSAALGRSSTPHKLQSRQSLCSIQGVDVGDGHPVEVVGAGRNTAAASKPMVQRRLRALALVYGRRAVSMDYERALFGMRLAACRALAQVHALPDSLFTCGSYGFQGAAGCVDWGLPQWPRSLAQSPQSLLAVALQA